MADQPEKEKTSLMDEPTSVRAVQWAAFFYCDLGGFEMSFFFLYRVYSAEMLVIISNFLESGIFTRFAV
jgi:hypothetical protein